MAAIGLPLWSMARSQTGLYIFDREAVFLERVLVPLRAELPEFRIVFEHVTTADGYRLRRRGAGSSPPRSPPIIWS